MGRVAEAPFHMVVGCSMSSVPFVHKSIQDSLGLWMKFTLGQRTIYISLKPCSEDRSGTWTLCRPFCSRVNFTQCEQAPANIT